jgi:predicted anti-sigma-YlaC factor YlaD
VTTDQNLRYQQNIADRSLAIAVLMAASWPRVERHAAQVVAQIDALSVGGYAEILIP